MDDSSLEDNLSDKIAALIKVISSVIPLPFVGSLVAEVMTSTVPNQRLDRIALFIKELEERVGLLEVNFKENKYAVDILEDAIKQAARSLSEERNHYLAIFVSKLGGVQKPDHSVKKKLLHIIEELTDIDIEILRSFRDEYEVDRFKYRPPFRSEADVAKLTEAEKYDSDLQQVSYDVHLETLERFSLLESEFQAPEFQKGGVYVDENVAKLPKKIGYHISTLGRVLLDSIGV